MEISSNYRTAIFAFSEYLFALRNHDGDSPQIDITQVPRNKILESFLDQRPEFASFRGVIETMLTPLVPVDRQKWSDIWRRNRRFGDLHGS